MNFSSPAIRTSKSWVEYLLSTLSPRLISFMVVTALGSCDSWSLSILASISARLAAGGALPLRFLFSLLNQSGLLDQGLEVVALF